MIADRDPHPAVIGLDLGGTKLLGVAIDPAEDGVAALAERRVPTPDGADLVDVIVALVDGVGADLAEQGRAVRAVGLGAPGLVDRTGTFLYGPNLPGVVGEPVAARVGERLGLPVVVDNDATCAAWGEHERGASRGANHSILVTVGTGIGGGITVKGEVLRGAFGFAGELGHVVVDPHGPLCPCGRHGCWERYASGNGLAWLAREAVRTGAAARDAGFVIAAGGTIDDVRGEHVVAAAREGDAGARAVLDTFADWLGLGIANLLNVLDSEVVVIGGGVSEEADLFIDRTRDVVAREVVGAGRRPKVPIVPARLGERAGAVGAALLAMART